MNSSPVCAARSRKYPSNISFQAAAWTVAVRVSTPSRSNRQARPLSGKPITASPSALSCDLSLPHAPPSDTSPLALGSSQYDSCPRQHFRILFLRILILWVETDRCITRAVYACEL